MPESPRKFATPQPVPSQMAFVAFVFGLAGIILCLGACAGIPALVLGVLSLRSIKNSHGTLEGRWLAVTAVVLGVLTLPLAFFQWKFFVPAIARYVNSTAEFEKMKNEREICLTNLRELSVACKAYSVQKQYSVSFIRKKRPDLLICPADTAATLENVKKFDTAASYRFAPCELAKPQDIWIYERKCFHGKKRNVVFVDGNAAAMKERIFQQKFREQTGRQKKTNPRAGK